MASWTDGAAYAPTERPDGFATPEAEPLADSSIRAPLTPGPLPPPREFQQNSPVVALEGVSSGARRRRNPSQPFIVSGGLMTAASSMGQRVARDPRLPFQTRRDTHGAGVLPPPTGEPLAIDMGAPPRPPGAGLDALMSAGVAPRTSGRGQSRQEMSTQKTLVFLAVACCVLGFAIGFVAPYMLIAAGALSLRATHLTGKAGMWAIGIGLALIVAGFVVTPEFEVLLGRLASLSFGIRFVSLALRRSNSSP